MNPDGQNYVKTKRTFNDAWAFILYVIYYIGVNSFLAMNIDASSMPTFNLKLLMVLSTSTLVLIVFNFLAFSFFCELTLKFSMILYPVLQVILIVLFPNPISIIFGVISLLFWILIIYNYWSRIPIVAKILTYSTKICLNHFFACIFGIALCSTLQIIQVILTFLAIPNTSKEVSTLLTAIVFLNFFWTLANFNYFFKVFISSLITFHFIEHGSENKEVFSSSLSNTMYSLGSISFAGLIIAIVQTLRLLVDRERSNRRQEDRNLLSEIFYCLLICIMAVLEDIIRFANQFAMPYIAIHGCKYVDAVKESFNLITQETKAALSGLTMLNCSLTILSLLMMCVTFILAYFTGVNDLKFDLNDKMFINSFINTIVAVLIVYFVTMSMFASSYLALIYLHAERPSLISKVDEDIAETCKAAKSF